MPIRTIGKILALACAFGLGYWSRPVKTRDVPGPVQLVFPAANRGVEIQSGLRWINVEAEVPIFQVDNEQAILAIAGMPPETPGFLEGLYTHEPNEAIYILGTWDLTAETAIHEYTHMLEADMPDQAWRIRRVFHKLRSDKFRIDATDLEADLPEPKPVFGPPAP